MSGTHSTISTKELKTVGVKDARNLGVIGTRHVTEEHVGDLSDLHDFAWEQGD
jgi:hypothetical protein